MTVHFMFSVRDRQLDAYDRPFIAPTRGAAIRSFYDAVKAKDTPMSMHPEDYSLHFIGSFDDTSGLVKTAGVLEQIALATDAVS